MRKSLLKLATVCSLFILGSTNVAPSILSFGETTVAQAQDLSATIELVRQLREKAWNENLPFDGEPLQDLYTDRDAYTSAVYWAPGLAEAAQIRAKEQAKAFGHTRPDGTNWDTVFSQAPGIKGEILAKNLTSLNDAIANAWGEDEFQALIDANGNLTDGNSHLYQLLSGQLSHIGFAEFKDEQGDAYYVGILADEDIASGTVVPLPEESESTTAEETEEDSTTTTTVEVTEESSSTTTTEEPETSSSTTTTVEPETSSSTTTTTVELETSSSTTTTTVEPETSSSTTTTTVEPETSSSTTTTTTVEETEASSSTTTTTVESTTAAPVTTTTTVEHTTAAPIHSVSIYPVAAGSQVVSGITTADANVTVTIKGKAQSYTAKADKQGAYSVKLSEALKAGDIVEVSSTVNGQTAVATKHVVATSSSTTQTATTTTAETTTKEGLPKTGETNNWIIMLAAALAVIAGIFLIVPGRRNKK